MGQETLFDSRGAPVAYIDYDDELTIYSVAGAPLAYLDGDNVYGFNGRHLGWYEGGVLWDHSGVRAGFRQDASAVFTQFEPFKGFKQFKPFKGFQQFAPFKPFKGAGYIEQSLEVWLERGRA